MNFCVSNASAAMILTNMRYNTDISNIIDFISGITFHVTSRYLKQH